MDVKSQLLFNIIYISVFVYRYFTSIAKEKEDFCSQWLLKRQFNIQTNKKRQHKCTIINATMLHVEHYATELH